MAGPDDHIARSRKLLLRAARMLATLEDFEVGGRDAYMAAFHAAEAIILARAGRVAKTHRGVRAEMSRIAQSDPRLDRTFTAFLANGYRLKERDDYLVASETLITHAEAQSAFDEATRLVAHAEWLLSQPEPPPDA